MDDHEKRSTMGTLAEAGDPLASAYATSEPRKSPQRRLAESFRHDEQYEDLLALRDRDPASFNSMSTHTRIAVASYEEAKQAAQAEGLAS